MHLGRTAHLLSSQSFDRPFAFRAENHPLVRPLFAYFLLPSLDVRAVFGFVISARASLLPSFGFCFPFTLLLRRFRLVCARRGAAPRIRTLLPAALGFNLGCTLAVSPASPSLFSLPEIRRRSFLPYAERVVPFPVPHLWVLFLFYLAPPSSPRHASFALLDDYAPDLTMRRGTPFLAALLGCFSFCNLFF